MSQIQNCIPRSSLHARANFGCGTDYREGWTNVDAVPDVDPDHVVDLANHPWPFPDDTFEYILASHVLEHLPDIEAALREFARVLQPDGILDLRLPVGVDANADPDHTWGEDNPWTWRTPEFYTGARHWDTDINLELESRNVDLWSLYSGLPKYRHHLRLKRREFWSGQGEWMFNQEATCGEFQIIYRKPDR